MGSSLQVSSTPAIESGLETGSENLIANISAFKLAFSDITAKSLFMNTVSCLLWIGLSALAFVGGVSCASYVTPGSRADFTTFTDPALKKAYTARPAAKFPANLALVRVQDSGYRNDETRGFGYGRYCVVTREDIANAGDMERLADLEGVQDVVRINQMLLPNELQSDLAIRNAGAKLHTDLMLLYTFDTAFEDRDLLKPLTTISLGLAPTKSFTAKSTASALIMDTRTGYIYSVLEASAEQGWTGDGLGRLGSHATCAQEVRA